MGFFRGIKHFVFVLVVFLLSVGIALSGTSESFVVSATGNVGIGKANPSVALDIKSITTPIRYHRAGGGGAGVLTIDCRISGADMVYYPEPDGNFGAGHAFYSSKGNGPFFAFGIDQYGKVAIGTTKPNAKLSINSTGGERDTYSQGLTLIRDADSGPASWGLKHGDNAHLYLGFASGPSGANEESDFSTKVVVQNHTGNVGIGTIAPQEKLHVDGYVYSNGTRSPSDLRWKENITPIDDALKKVTDLRGVNYEWMDKSRGQGSQLGVIAQEVEDVFPEAVHTDDQGYKSVEYSKLVAPLIEAVKALKNENDSLRNRNEKLEERLSRIEAKF